MKLKSKKVAKKSSGNEQDIVALILEHHKPLKKLIKVLKGDSEYSEKKPVFKEFASLLISHAKPEEETLYVAMKKDSDLRSEAFEGDTEHGLADQLVEEAKRTKDKDLWMARVKVLAELVEHHIEEEEEDILPDYRKSSDAEQRVVLGGKYTQLREKLLDHGGVDSPHEKSGRAIYPQASEGLRH